MKLETQQIINVQAYKHNGDLYRQWNGIKVIEKSSKDFILLIYKTKVLKENGQKWVIKEPILWFFHLDKFFNTTAIIRENGIYYYTNIASPPIFESGTIKYIDYDIDIKAYPNQKVKIIDEKEFDCHKKKFKYDDDLIKKINCAVTNVVEIIEYQKKHFNFSFIKKYIQNLVKNNEIDKKFLFQLYK